MKHIAAPLAALVLLFPGLALAKAITTLPPPPPAKPALAYTIPSTMVGMPPHSCGRQFYPDLARRLDHEGATLINFRVKVDGSVGGITVARSSGYDELDQASVLCAQDWKYRPATQNGQPVEVPWRANITWKLNYPLSPATPSFWSSQHCTDYRPDEGRAPQYPAYVVMRVDEQGHVAEAAVRDSSGDTAYDAYVVTCVSKWKYNPAMQGDTAVSSYVHAALTWNGAPVAHDSFPTLASTDDICPERRKTPGAPDPSGKTRVLFEVELDGSVQGMRIADSSGDKVYDGYVADCVSHWKFNPAIVGGRPKPYLWYAAIGWVP